MSKLQYSPEAHNILNQFYSCSYLIYVEGKDDIIFWKRIFQLADINNARFEELGGADQLNDKCNLIMETDCNFYVARDLDHNAFIENKYIHKKIIYTYGYSIENTLYCEQNLKRLVQNMYRIEDDIEENIIGYISIVESSTYELLIYDIGNHKFKKSVEIFGDTCFKFLANDKDYYLDSNKIYWFINSIRSSFSEDEINLIKSKLIEEKRKIKYLIKGHFLTQIIVNYIKYGISKEINHKPINISSNLFFTTLVDGCSCCGSQKINCEDIQYLISSIKFAVKSA